MAEEKKVSSYVNYRWVRGSECERNRNWRQWSAIEKKHSWEKNKMPFERKMCLCVCLS